MRLSSPRGYWGFGGGYYFSFSGLSGFALTLMADWGASLLISMMTDLSLAFGSGKVFGYSFEISKLLFRPLVFSSDLWVYYWLRYFALNSSHYSASSLISFGLSRPKREITLLLILWILRTIGTSSKRLATSTRTENVKIITKIVS